MAQEHPNVTLLKRLDIRNLSTAKDLITEDFVWHFFNPKLPDVQGDYVGLNGFQSFFEKMGAKTKGTFKVDPISVTAFGDELVVVHARDTLTMESEPICLDVVVVWRIVGGRIVEAWDIPSVYTTANPAGADATQAQQR